MPVGYYRDAGKFQIYSYCAVQKLILPTSGRIVEYASREQAQHAVATLSNQNLMGRLVYVREVSLPALDSSWPTQGGHSCSRRTT